MALSPGRFPLRVRHAGANEVHAARSHPVKGHQTACLLWLDPEHPHTWAPEDAEVTCSKCLERLGPTNPRYAAEVPGTTGTLQERLAGIIENEVPLSSFPLVGERVTEVVENWRREVEEGVHRAVDETLAGALPEAVRSAVAHALVERVLRSMNVGYIRNEGVKR
ncbi:hypothetical protein ACFW2V_13140 [Streptomyces sp. NPDC058947]|uniref:hypothetical protein n=1 Tax=Streptomyces sp. NPDC058947 TaxID=3346675 RepID=UPI00369DED90